MKNLDFFKKLLSVPTYTYHEDKMIAFLESHLESKGYEHYVDDYGNVYVTKGVLSEGENYPCVVAHTDTVHKLDTINVFEETLPNSKGQDSLCLKAYNDFDEPTGIGGDDKCGVFACLELLDKFDVIKAAFFVSEEVGCIGSKNADDRFFDDVGYVIEFDAPGDYMVTHYCFGVKLYDQDSEFFEKTDKVLTEHMLGTPQYMVHPYTDVYALKKKYDFACINFSIGYHNYHTKDEYICVEEVEAGIKSGEELIKSLGKVKHHFDHPSKVNM
jgi:di/tripeptidase